MPHLSYCGSDKRTTTVGVVPAVFERKDVGVRSTHTDLRRRHTRFMALALALVVLFGLHADVGAQPPRVDMPAGFDDFLSLVRAHTAPTAGVVLVGDMPLPESQRATFALYPRAVSMLPDLRPVPAGTRAPRWPTLLRFAHQRDARYIALWRRSASPLGKASLHGDDGVLVEVGP